MKTSASGSPPVVNTSITELVIVENLFVFQEGYAWQDVHDGVYDADGRVSCLIDGGLKCFGYVIGASGLRMIDEAYLQPRHRAGARQSKDPKLAPTSNLGGASSTNVCSAFILGLH